MPPVTRSRSASAAERTQQPSTTPPPPPEVSRISEGEEGDPTPPGFRFSRSEGHYLTPMDGWDPPPHFPCVPTDTPSNPFHHCTPEADSVVSRQQYLKSLHVCHDSV